MKTIIKLSFFIVALNLTHSLFASSGNIGESNRQAQEKIFNYWTPERLVNAKEMPHPQFNPNGVVEIDKDTLRQEVSQHHEGTPPVKNIKPDLSVLIPKSLLALKEKPLSQNFFDRGVSGYYFTSSRLNPLAADLEYPYSAVGILFFTIPGSGDFSCTAATINQRIIVTAGHCVHSGANGLAGYYTNFLFIPAYRDGMAPFQTWSGTFALTTDAWATSGGLVPNAADYAMIEVSDKVINGSTMRLGNVTGAIGWLTSAIMPNHVHILGYPFNFDSSQKMHQVMAQTARVVEPNNAEIGSDMGPGSSGGPWVQNFGPNSVGQPGGYSPYRNLIVGITSYGYTDSSIMLEGTSVLDSRFVDLYYSICAHRAGNCI